MMKEITSLNRGKENKVLTAHDIQSENLFVHWIGVEGHHSCSCYCYPKNEHY